MKNKKIRVLKTNKEVQQMLNSGIVIIAVVLIVVSVFVKYYNSYMDGILYAERLNQMKEVTGQLFAGLDDVVESQWSAAQVYCNYVERGAPKDLEQLLTFMEKQAELNNLEEKQSDIVAVDNRGIYFTQKGRQGSLNEMQYLLEEPERVSFISKSMTKDETKMYFLIKLPSPVSMKDGNKTVKLIYYGIACNMKKLNPYFTCEAYQGNNTVYVLDNSGQRLFAGNNEEVLSGYNLFSILKTMKYLHGSSLEKAKEELDLYGMSYSNAMLDGEEYYYSLYKMNNTEWILLFLVPSDYVAVNTVQMMNTTVQMVLIFSIALLGLCVVILYWMLRRRQKKEIAIERAMNQQLEILNKKLEETAKAAEQASRAKSDFLANMSHDIRTPMNAIVGITSLMEHEQGISDKLSNYIKKVQLSSRHLLGLINDILDMSRIESNEVVLNIENVSLAEQIGQIDSIIREQTNEHHQKFHIHQKGIVHEYLICDGMRLRQVLLNLLSNAVKYTPNGGEITLEFEETSCDVLDHARFICRVKDNGYGMTKEFVGHIFEPFTRAESSVTNKVQGTGLGMAITKNIVDLMGGEIHVKSEVGKGSCFEVILTLQVNTERNYEMDAIATAKTNNTSNNNEEEETSILKGMRFLCAEDNELNAEILEEILKMYDAECTIYPDGVEIVQAFRDVKPGEYDAILMDIQMPKMNGLEATKAIRNSENPLGKTIPIIAMTANAFSEDAQHCIDAGMNVHIAKPIDIKILEKTLQNIAGGGKS